MKLVDVKMKAIRERQGKRQKVMSKLSNLSGWYLRHLKSVFLLMLAFSLIWTQLLVLESAEAAISQRGTATTGTVAAGTSISVNKPTGVISGDVMIATVVTGGTPTVTSTGWTAIDGTSNTTLRLTTFYKIAGTSEGSSYSFTWTGNQNGAAGIVAFKGVDVSGANPIDNSGAAHSTNSGSGTTLTASSVTTNSANTMLIASFGNLTTGGISQPTGMSEKFDVTSSSVDASGNTETVASTGATGTRAATGTSANWVAHLVALKAASAPTLNQSAYRFAVNADNTTPEKIVDNLTANDDTVSGSAVDANGYFFTVGDNGSNWVIEKRRIADGSLCTSTNCGTTFGTSGRVTEDVASSTTEKAYAIAVDNTDDSIYVVGMDQVTTNSQWRVEKRSMTTGNLVTSFNTTGVVQSNPTAGTDEATTVVIDTVNNYLYVGGYDSTTGNEWRVEKYRTSDGAYCTAANCGTQFGTNGVYTNNISANNDQITIMTLDPTRSYLFIAGSAENGGGSKKQWTLFKLHATNANLCTAAECGTAFDTDGIYTSDPDNARDDQLLALQVDAAGNAIYLGGFEAYGVNRTRWRIEKINIDTAARDGTFNNGACSGAGNSVCVTFTTNVLDKIYDMDLDGAGGYIYVYGVTDEAGTDSSWRIQKRQRSDGSLVSAWASSGTVTLNPSSDKDPTTNIVLDIDRSLMWVVGGDRSLGATNMQWYFAPLSLDSGTTWLAAQDTVAVASTSITVRLRLLIHSNTQQFLAGSQNLKLQYSPKSGTCDTGFSGENYVDITTSTEVAYHDNPSISDATTMVTVTGDPAHSSDTTVLQTMEELNDFNPTVDIPPSQDGEWDFILKDNSAFGAYCVRAVYDDGSSTPFNTYTVIPEINFCRDDPRTDNLMRHGTYFCGGLKKSFFWAL